MIGLTCPDRAYELAEQLISRFGSLSDVLATRSADRKELLAEVPEVERQIACVHQILIAALKSRVERKSVLSNHKAVTRYLRAVMGVEPNEQFRVLFLNSANQLLHDEIFAIGTVHQVYVHPREILKRGLEIGATAMVLAHNHPSGSLLPSKADRTLTKKIMIAAGALDIVIHDHLVVGRNAVLSFRASGYL